MWRFNCRDKNKNNDCQKFGSLFFSFPIAYFFGLSRISFPFFLIATSLARLPGTIFMNYQGVEAYEGNYGIVLGLAALYAGVAYLLYKHREALYQWLERWHAEEY